MGCLSFFIDLLVESIIDGWFYLMQWIIPDRYLTRTLRVVLKVIVLIFSAVLFMVMFLGVFAIISPDPDTHLLGRYMVFIPLGISAIQIALGIIVHAITSKRE